MTNLLRNYTYAGREPGPAGLVSAIAWMRPRGSQQSRWWMTPGPAVLASMPS